MVQPCVAFCKDAFQIRACIVFHKWVLYKPFQATLVIRDHVHIQLQMLVAVKSHCKYNSYIFIAKGFYK